MLKLVLINLLETFAESANVFCSQSGNCISYIMFFFQKKSSKRSCGHVEFNFRNPVEILSSKSKMLLLKVCMRWKNYQFYFGKDSRNVPLDTLAPFLTTLKKCSAKMPKCFPAKVGKDLKNSSFQKLFFLRTFLWIPRKQLWQPCWSFLPEVPTLLLDLPKRIGIYFFKVKIFLLRPFQWTHERQFGKPWWNILVKVLKKWLEVQKRSKRTSILFKNVVSPQNVPLDTQIAILTSLPKFFCQNVDSSSLIFRKSRK